MNLSEQEFEKKYYMYKDTIYNIAFTYVHNESDASDIIQDVFMKYLKSNKSFPSNDDEKYWLIRVTINTCLSFIKSSWKKKVELVEEIDLGGAYTQENFIYYEAITTLPEIYKEVLILHYYENFKIEEISKILKTNNNVIKKRLQRAKLMLKEKIQEN